MQCSTPQPNRFTLGTPNGSACIAAGRPLEYCDARRLSGPTSRGGPIFSRWDSTCREAPRLNIWEERGASPSRNASPWVWNSMMRRAYGNEPHRTNSALFGATLKKEIRVIPHVYCPAICTLVSVHLSVETYSPLYAWLLVGHQRIWRVDGHRVTRSAGGAWHQDFLSYEPDTAR